MMLECWNAGMLVPLTWDDKAGCISARCGGKHLVLDLGLFHVSSLELSIQSHTFMVLLELQQSFGRLEVRKLTCDRMEP